MGDASPEQTLIFTSPSFNEDTLSAKALTLSMANISHTFEHFGICTHFDCKS